MSHSVIALSHTCKKVDRGFAIYFLSSLCKVLIQKNFISHLPINDISHSIYGYKNELYLFPYVLIQTLQFAPFCSYAFNSNFKLGNFLKFHQNHLSCSINTPILDFYIFASTSDCPLLCSHFPYLTYQVHLYSVRADGKTTIKWTALFSYGKLLRAFQLP